MIDYTLPLNELPDPLPIKPLNRSFDVTITPPGSKSITNRAYVLAALAGGESRIVRPLRSDDCDYLLNALATLGAQAQWDGPDVVIQGVSGRFPRGGEVNLGDGGAPARFMIAAACLALEPVVVDGSERMRQRPVSELVDFLRQLGADVAYVQEDGHLPVRVSPSMLGGDDLEIGRTQSSQFISALLQIAPCLPFPLKLWFEGETTSWPYVKMTLHVMKRWGIDSHEATHADGRRSVYVYNRPIRGRVYEVEADASSATYWLAAGAIMPKSGVRIEGLPAASAQGDLAFAALLEKLGARRQHGGANSVGVYYRKTLHGGDHDMSDMPDAAMTLAAAVAFADSPSIITGLHTLRVKESDRVAALASELTKIGCDVQTTDDALGIDPSTRHEEPVVIETYNDHRMAMAFAILGLKRPNVSIANPKCVSKSYPTFWQDFAKLYE
ncbi:MAG: 3-phosphoshikimate 1-carboxyvinyltransferase [Phycisphaerales bacterium]|nr:MAG: 3-phosphoshikimate 1-carboxyvinyltransferase [Phycisphaerales bacterium]